MSEVITEMVLPGTYIEVRAEGLLTIGAIATGNVGVIGTAHKGDGQVAVLSSFEEGRARFGEAGDWDSTDPAGNVHLVRGLRLLFDNGARTVYAQRVVNAASAKAATYQITSETGAPILKLVAKTPGEWGNRLQIRVEAVEAQELISEERVPRNNGVLALSAQKLYVPAPNGGPPTLGMVAVREQGVLSKYQLRQDGPTAETVKVDANNPTLNFLARPAAEAEIRASYWVPKENLRKVTLRYANSQEVYTVPSMRYLAQRLTDPLSPSKLVDVEGDPSPSSAGLPKAGPRFETFKEGVNGTATLADYQAALDALAEQPVQLVVVLGQKFGDIKSAILGHVEKTENLGRERIAIVGADSSEPDKILENANDIADKRVVLVAPGLKQKDPETGQVVELPPYYAAAAVAGKLASLSPHVSPTNKTLAGIDALAATYNYGDLKALVQNRVLVLERKHGIRVVKGTTTDGEAFKQITLRRIVDYVKEGTRIGANQYIGKLNNRRVRENLRTTLDGFLADLLTREFLTGYKLTVFADRPMEIRGEVQVIMELNPTFSIDVIRVVMNLS